MVERRPLAERAASRGRAELVRLGAHALAALALLCHELEIAFELSDADREYFRGAMRDVKATAHGLDEKAIIAAASRLAAETGSRVLGALACRERRARRGGSFFVLT